MNVHTCLCIKETSWLSSRSAKIIESTSQTWFVWWGRMLVQSQGPGIPQETKTKQQSAEKTSTLNLQRLQTISRDPFQLHKRCWLVNLRCKMTKHTHNSGCKSALITCALVMRQAEAKPSVQAQWHCARAASITAPCAQAHKKSRGQIHSELNVKIFPSWILKSSNIHVLFQSHYCILLNASCHATLCINSEAMPPRQWRKSSRRPLCASSASRACV